MNDYLKLFINQPDKTCFILEDNSIIFSSIEHGVKPILDFYHKFGNNKENLILVDKIMGRGAIILARLINATSIVTPIISKDALDLAEYYGMNVYYEIKADYIINRNKDGRCPIESSVLEITDEKVGYQIILKTLEKLANKK